MINKEKLRSIIFGYDTKAGKQFDIINNSLSANLITSEAIFLLTKKTYEPIKLKSKKISHSSQIVFSK